MTYEEALKIAEENAKGFPTFEKDGRVWITVEGKSYPRDWFVRTAARMKAEGTI